MPTMLESPQPIRGKPRAAMLPLENGDRMTSDEFLRRAENTPTNKKIELIEGHVHMPPPLRADAHSEPDNLIQTFLGFYAASVPGLKCYGNPTLRLDNNNIFQPDSVLCTAPRPNHRVWLDERGYLSGSPELVCEIAASSVSIDLHDKFAAYLRNGIAEYFVWVVAENRVRWFALEDGNYIELQPKAGIVCSRVFKGLALDVKAILKRDGAKVLATLRRHLPRRRN